MPYTIYQPDIEGTIYPQTGLFAIGIEGYVIMEDEGSMRGLVEAAWDSIAIGKNCTVFFFEAFNVKIQFDGKLVWNISIKFSVNH